MLLEELAVLTVYGYVARLKRALQLLCPDAYWSWMNPMLRKLNKRARQAGHKRARPIVSPKNLFAYGIKLIKQAEATAPPVDVRADVACGDEQVLRAELYRDSLAQASTVATSPSFATLVEQHLADRNNLLPQPVAEKSFIHM